MAITITNDMIEQSVQEHHLNLKAKSLNHEDVDLICRYLEEHPNITSLDLSQNNIGDEGARKLAQNTTLTTLNMEITQISFEGARSLAQHPRLNCLNVSANPLIGDLGAVALAQNPRLRNLDVSFTNLQEAGATALAGHQNLQSLNVASNAIGDQALKKLAQSTSLINLNLQGLSIVNAAEGGEIAQNLGQMLAKNLLRLRLRLRHGINTMLQGLRDPESQLSKGHLPRRTLTQAILPKLGKLYGLPQEVIVEEIKASELAHESKRAQSGPKRANRASLFAQGGQTDKRPQSGSEANSDTDEQEAQASPKKRCS